MMQQLKKKGAKTNHFIVETILRNSLNYVELIKKSKGTKIKEIVEKDFIYLICGCVSINLTISKYCKELLVEYLGQFPFASFSAQVL